MHSPATTGSMSAKKRKLHEVLWYSPPESDSSEPKYQDVCCWRDRLDFHCSIGSGLRSSPKAGEGAQAHFPESAAGNRAYCREGWARLGFSILDARYKQDKYPMKRNVPKKRKPTWA